MVLIFKRLSSKSECCYFFPDNIRKLIASVIQGKNFGEKEKKFQKNIPEGDLVP